MPYQVMRHSALMRQAAEGVSGFDARLESALNAMESNGWTLVASVPREGELPHYVFHLT